MTRPGHLKKGHILSRVPFLGRRMFSQAKWVREQTATPAHIQQPSSQDIPAQIATGEPITNTCGLRQKNPPLNGYPAQGGRARLDITGQIYQTEVTSVRWKWPPGTGLPHNGISVNYSLRECSLVVHRQQTEPHPFLRKCALDAPTQFRGHGNCGVPVCSAEQQSGSVLTEQCTADWKDASCNSPFNRDSELCTSNNQGAISRCLGRVTQDVSRASLEREVMPSTKDVNETNVNHFEWQANGDLDGLGTCAITSKPSHGAIQDQIQRVVVNLEEVLRGLKEIHLEMKEVVQKIDLLTADIDMDEEELGDALKGPCSEKMDNPTFKEQSPSVAPPPYQSRDPAGQKLESTQELATTRKPGSGTVSGHRNKKPPPYPNASTVGRANPKAKDRKAPPYPFRRRLLSTIV